MNIKIELFKENLIDAIGSGIYEISIVKENGDRGTLYIGESVFVLVRCATHLYELKRKPEYFGFTPHTIENNNISLEFNFYKKENDREKRKKIEKKLIQQKNPLSQSGISDRQKKVEEKIIALEEFLKSN